MFEKPVLCYVTERASLPLESGVSPLHALLAYALRAARAGVDWIQIREKDLSSRDLLALASEIVRQAAPARAFVNDRLDVALTAASAGVHLGAESLPVAAAALWCRENAPRGFLVGKSCHSIAEARAAENEGAHYVFFGPIFPTPSKLAFGPPQGLGRLSELCSQLRIPAIAIGGITPENAARCIASGAAGVAAIRLFQEPGDLPARIAALRAAGR